MYGEGRVRLRKDSRALRASIAPCIYGEAMFTERSSLCESGSLDEGQDHICSRDPLKVLVRSSMRGDRGFQGYVGSIVVRDPGLDITERWSGRKYPSGYIGFAFRRHLLVLTGMLSKVELGARNTLRAIEKTKRYRSQHNMYMVSPSGRTKLVPNAFGGRGGGSR